MVYYISDIHLGDLRVYEKCSRPFKSLQDMEFEIIKKWNKKVKVDDIVYVLGDIAEDNNLEALKTYKSLNGHKHLIVGNHDLKMLDKIESERIFESINYIVLIDDDKRKVCLCHYPLMDWMEFNRDSYHVYGHIHNKTDKNGYAYVQIKAYFKDKLAFNCGVDVTEFEPVTLDEMIKLKEDNKDEPYIN